MLKIFLFLFIFIIQFPAFSNQDSTAVDTALEPLGFGDAYIEDYLSNPEYQYMDIDEEENWYEKLKRKFFAALNRFFNWLIGEGSLGKFGNFIVQALPYLAVFILSLVLLWFITKYDVYTDSDKTLEKGQGILSEEDDIIHHEDIQGLIQQAIARGDFRLAIRYSYLSILRKMMDKDMIQWKIQKTNHDYIDEIPVGELKSDFISITRVYDYVWYGDFVIDQGSFEKIIRSFDKLEKKL